MDDVNTYFHAKILPARLVAAPVAIVLAPVVLFFWLMIKLTSRGPGFYTQERLGRHGRPFRIIKLRTMLVDAESKTGAVWSTDNDPRVTRIGRFLRRTHLDELPQIFNVLFGHMCFVGPRPERPEIVDGLVNKIPGYLDRLSVKPGVTGWAQLHLPADKTIDCVCKKLGYDFTYIRTATLTSDLRVCLATACKLIPLVGDRLAFRLMSSPTFCTAADAAAESLRNLAWQDEAKRSPRTPAATRK